MTAGKGNFRSEASRFVKPAARRKEVRRGLGKPNGARIGQFLELGFVKPTMSIGFLSSIENWT